MGKKNSEDGHNAELERKIIKVAEDILNLDLNLKRTWKIIERELRQCLNNKNYKVHFDNFFNFPHIKTVKVEFVGVPFPTKENPHVYRSDQFINLFCDPDDSTTNDNNLKILYLERKDRFLLVPARMGKFIEELETHDSRFVKKENNRGNLLPVIKSEAAREYDGLVEEINNRYIPSVAIIRDKYFLICISSESSIKNLFEYRQELSEIFHKHFRNKVGRPQTKEFYQNEFNYRFMVYRALRWSIDKCCKKIAEDFKQEFDYSVNPETVKRNYYQEYKKTLHTQSIELNISLPAPDDD